MLCYNPNLLHQSQTECSGSETTEKGVHVVLSHRTVNTHAHIKRDYNGAFGRSAPRLDSCARAVTHLRMRTPRGWRARARPLKRGVVQQQGSKSYSVAC
jgi:hypothetical protein